MKIGQISCEINRENRTETMMDERYIKKQISDYKFEKRCASRKVNLWETLLKMRPIWIAKGMSKWHISQEESDVITKFYKIDLNKREKEAYYQRCEARIDAEIAEDKKKYKF